ncbi:hypothetical protein EDM80_04280 [bacterium]|nr:MAG: hypothetical protein EDM80_04280 [bacterium]RIK61615.1 MAG: hypothetical protein DCC64_12935 [Planctomycetota bacterium]
MPQQAILDLPLVEFEQFDGQVDALQRRCVAIYGLTGLPPHQDAAFHLTASLFRYRDAETLFQLAALSSFFLRSLTQVLALERRAQTLSSRLREGPRDSGLLHEVRDEFARIQARSNQLGRLLLAVVGRHALSLRASRASSSARLTRNLDSLAEPSFQRSLEEMLEPLSRVDLEGIDFDLEPAEFLRQLEREKAAILRPSNGHAPAADSLARADVAVEEAEASLRGLGALKAELDELRAELKATSERMAVMVRERHELDLLLRESERIAQERALALEDARAALELTVSEARERLARVEREQTSELEQARRRAAETEQQRRALAEEVQTLRARLDELAQTRQEAEREMTRVIERATLREGEREELLARLEASDSEREVAARTIEALKEKLGQSKDQVARRDEQVQELQDTLAALREELVETETRLANAQASIVALEGEAEELRSEAARATRTIRQRHDSEARLAQAEARRAEAELRITQLEAALAAAKEQEKQSEARLKEQRRNVEVVSGQLAEAETLSNERAAQVRQLEIELGEARRNLGENQARLSETSARLKLASTSTKDAEETVSRLRRELDELRRAQGALESAMQAREREVARLRQSEADLARRAEKAEAEQARLSRELEQAASAQNQKAGQTEQELQSTRQKLVAAELKLMDLEQKLDGAQEDARATTERLTDSARRTEAELQLLRERLTHAEAERSAALQEVARAGQRAQGEQGELERSLAQAQERLSQLEKEAARDKGESDKTRRKLDETESFLIARQRELERVQTRLKYLTGEVKSIADLRTQMEQAGSESARQASASEIARRMDNLFAEAGAPVTADRRTEKIVVMHLKKSDAELAAEAGGSFIATARPAADESKGTEVHEGRPIKGKRTTRRSRKEREGHEEPQA